LTPSTNLRLEDAWTAKSSDTSLEVAVHPCCRCSRLLLLLLLIWVHKLLKACIAFTATLQSHDKLPTPPLSLLKPSAGQYLPSNLPRIVSE
jgi:hypothetical protein